MFGKRMPQYLAINRHLRNLLIRTTWRNDLTSSQTIHNFCNDIRLFFSNQFNSCQLHKTLREQSVDTVKLWMHQCECVIAQRVRRSQQMFSLYTRLWEERALRELILRLRQQFTRHSRSLMWGSAALVVFDWDANRIPLAELLAHMDEIAYMKQLRTETSTTCSPGMETQCTDAISPEAHPSSNDDGWSLFISQQDLMVWRRRHLSGAFEYKVYGSYNDVTAEDFLNVQVDIQYRRQWDTTAVSLRVIDEDPNEEVYGDVIYWEMLWPKLFVNRDYVFNRRYFVDCDSKTAIIISKSTRHPDCPEEKEKFRVHDYQSCMVIKPYTELNKPGIEFGLTYFDNPGVNIPSAITSWVAMKAMPDFLSRMREATKGYTNYCETTGNKCVCILRSRKDGSPNLKKGRDGLFTGPGFEVMTSPSPIIQADSKASRFWHYNVI